LVTLVTLLVNEFKSPITLPEKVCTPPTTEAAKVAPGNEDEPRPNEAPGSEPADTVEVPKVR
jgi:hypothetical protein